MKYRIKTDEKPEPVVDVWLEESPTGIKLLASSGDLIQTLVILSNTGTLDLIGLSYDCIFVKKDAENYIRTSRRT